MLAFVLSLLSLGGGLGALAYFVGPKALLGAGRSVLGFLGKIPWQAYALAALAALIAFLYISRGHWMDRAKADEARAVLVCQAVRDVAGRAHQDCRLNATQIMAFGKSIQDLEGAIADQNRRIRELGRKSAELQASLVGAKRQAAKRANQVESVANRVERSSKVAPAQPCPVSKVLEDQWR